MVVIGLTPTQDPKTGHANMRWSYALSVLRAGALPVILPMFPEDQENYDGHLRQCLDLADGFVFIGGGDVHPEHYSEALHPRCGEVDPIRDKMDLALMEMALDARKPLLCICRGMQALNVAAGGTLYQDLASQRPDSLQHAKSNAEEIHPVKIEKGSLLHQIVGQDALMVSSSHHQAVKQLAPGMKATAWAEDGVVEAIEFEDGRPVLGVQWHPETLTATRPAHLALFQWLVGEAGKRARIGISGR
ncbi:MAG: gamma-glutamyl-gamma-aminobutyrate hydrolase family protein [Kiritimatiellia bacterium]|jgi:putative glutamine amidotransferase